MTRALPSFSNPNLDRKAKIWSVDCCGLHYVKPQKMTIEATSKTAAIAGVWSALGFVPFDAWLDHHKSISALSHNVTFLAVGAVFLFIPVYFLVIGQGNEPFNRTWFLDKEERERYGIVFRRMLVWFISAGAFGMVWSLVFDLVLRKVFGL